MNYVAMYSGGKDSTAMLILIKEHQLPLDKIVYINVGEWMWPGSEEHLQKVEDWMEMPITRIDISEQLHEGFQKWGFPSPLVRWCTGEKRKAINNFVKELGEVTQYIGIAFDEKERLEKGGYRKGNYQYPLVDYEVIESEALQMCYNTGFNFGGVYEHRSRYNCWCCPLQKLDELRVLFKFYPELWIKMREMQWISPNDFRQGETIFSLEHRWWNELNGKMKGHWDKLVRSGGDHECTGSCHVCGEDKQEVLL